jgi:hypothetical protein
MAPAACIKVGVYKGAKFFGVDDDGVAHYGLQVRLESGAGGSVIMFASKYVVRGGKKVWAENSDGGTCAGQ